MVLFRVKNLKRGGTLKETASTLLFVPIPSLLALRFLVSRLATFLLLCYLALEGGLCTFLPLARTFSTLALFCAWSWKGVGGRQRRTSHLVSFSPLPPLLAFKVSVWCLVNIHLRPLLLWPVFDREWVAFEDNRGAPPMTPLRTRRPPTSCSLGII